MTHETTRQPTAEGSKDVEITFERLSFLPPRHNERLAEFFQSSSTHSRVYLLLLSLVRHHSLRTANAMAFDFFLALIPMLGVAGWASSLILRSAQGPRAGTAFSSIAPADLNDFLGRHFEALAAAHLAPLAVIVGWWLSSSAFNTMIGVFEETFECLPRNWLRRRLVSLGFALLGVLFLGSAGALGVVVASAPSLVLWFVDLLRQNGLFRVAVALFAYLAMTAFLALFFRFSLIRPRVARRVWPGAFISSSIGFSSSLLLGYYATHLANYALFYGGLAVIVVVLSWLWLWSSALLIGAEINIALEDVRGARLSTMTPPTPDGPIVPR